LIGYPLDVGIRQVRWRALIGLALLGFALRLFMAALIPVHLYDHESYQLVADITARGGNVYAETMRYNYSPLWLWFLSALDQFPGDLMTSVHLVVATADVMLGVLIGLVAATFAKPAPLFAALYLLNPAAILLSGLYAQFEALALVPLLVAVLLVSRQRLAAAHRGSLH